MTHGGNRPGAGRPRIFNREEAAKILARIGNGERYTDLAREFGCTRQTIHKTVDREILEQRDKFGKDWHAAALKDLS